MKTRKKAIGKKLSPRFRTVEQESNFWDEHSPLEYGVWQEVSYDEMLEDLKEQAERKRQISLRLEPELIENLKRLARNYKIPYQKLARELLKRGVAGLSKA